VGDTILCHATAITVKVSPDDAVLCITVKDSAGNPLQPGVQRGASNGIYAGNIDFGPMPAGPAILHICYAKDGVSCTSGVGGCSLVPIVVQCTNWNTLQAPKGGAA
jgi:hypothetical protein